MKTIEFLRYRRPDLEIRMSFLQQLTAYEARLSKAGLGAKTATWIGTFPSISSLEVFETTSAFENEELLLRNTYINAHIVRTSEEPINDPKKKKSRRLLWSDNKEGKTEQLATAIVEDEEGPVEGNIPKQSQVLPKPILRKQITMPQAEKKLSKPNVTILCSIFFRPE